MEGRLVWYSEELRGEGGGWSGLYDRKRGGEGRTVIVTLSRTLIFGVYDGWAAFFLSFFPFAFPLSHNDDARQLKSQLCAEKEDGPPSGGRQSSHTSPPPLPATGRPEKLEKTPEKGKKGKSINKEGNKKSPFELDR